MLDLSRGSTATRFSIALAVSAGMALVSAGVASAAGGLPPAPAPIAAAPVTAPPAAPALVPPAAPTGATVLPVNLFITVPIIGSIPLPAPPPPPFAATPAPAPLTAGLIQLSTGAKDALNQIGAGLAPTPLAPLAASGAAGAVANIVAQAAPLATVCVQVTGSGTALLNTDLKLLGIDLSSPLIQTFPGFLAPCPVGSVPATATGSTASGSTTPGSTTPGSTIVGVNTNLGSLVGACVRVTTSVVPLQVTLLVLNQDVISKLTAAGLPLRQLIVPCPTGTPTPGTGGPGGGGPGGGGGGIGGPGGGGPGGGGPASGFPTMGSLPFTGAEIGLLMALAAAVIGAGTMMVRKTRTNQWAVNI